MTMDSDTKLSLALSVFLIFSVAAGVFALKARAEALQACRRELVSKGYSEGDIAAFSKITRFNSCEIAASQGLQAQLTLFSKGADTGFMSRTRTRNAQEDADSARSQAGIATAISISNMGR